MSRTKQLLQIVLTVAILVITAFAFLGFWQFADAEPLGDDAKELSDEYFARVNQAVEICPKIQLYYKEENEDSYVDDYCGMFLDEAGYINLMVIDPNSSLCEKVQKEFPETIVCKAKYSYNSLLYTQKVLAKEMQELSINKISLRQKMNKLEINLEKDDESRVLAYLKTKNLSCEDAIIFNNDSKLIPNKDAKGGTETWYNYGFLWLNKSYGTICVNAIDNDTGAKGVLTNAHVAEPNKTMKHSEGTLSKRTKGWYGGTIDAAFVPFPNNSWSLTDKATYDGTITYGNIRLGTESHIVEGYPTKKIGVTTGITTGTITSTNTYTNFSYNDGEPSTYINNVIEYSNASIPGDSGGPVYFNGGPKASLWLIAMNYAGPVDYNNYTYGIGCRISNVMSQLNVTIITHDNIYNY